MVSYAEDIISTISTSSEDESMTDDSSKVLEVEVAEQGCASVSEFCKKTQNLQTFFYVAIR